MCNIDWLSYEAFIVIIFAPRAARPPCNVVFLDLKVLQKTNDWVLHPLKRAKISTHKDAKESKIVLFGICSSMHAFIGETNSPTHSRPSPVKPCGHTQVGLPAPSRHCASASQPSEWHSFWSDGGGTVTRNGQHLVGNNIQ